MAESPRRRGVPVFGLFLIAAGVLLLLQTLGVVPWAIWQGLWRLWPVLLIMGGVAILFGGRARWLAAAVIVLLLGGAIALAAYGSNGFRDDTEGVQGFSELLLDAKFLDATLDFGAGDIRLDALPADSVRLMEATLRGSGEKAKPSVSRTADRAFLRLERKSPRWFFFGGVKEEWDVSLSRTVAINLTINAGASNIAANLSELNVTALRLSAGASNVSLVLPGQAERAFARLDVGAAHVQVRVPEGVAARIRSETGVSSVDVNTARFPKVGGYYQSPDYDTAAKRVDVEIRGGVADITVR